MACVVLYNRWLLVVDLMVETISFSETFSDDDIICCNNISSKNG